MEVVKVLEEDRLIKGAVRDFDKYMVEDTAIMIKTLLAMIWRVPRTYAANSRGKQQQNKEQAGEHIFASCQLVTVAWISSI